jgi:SpoVK/Ycf46/Vps4 family AAA+-type ATPase
MSSAFDFIHLVTYYSNEFFHENRKKARSVFELTADGEISYQLLGRNKKHKQTNWTANIQVKCYCIDTGSGEKVVYEFTQNNKLIVLTDEYVDISGEITTKQKSRLPPGTYYMVAIVDEIEFRSDTFNVYNWGEVSEEGNPYFSIEGIQMFDADDELEDTGLVQFDTDITDHIRFEIRMKNKMIEVPWVCELFVSCFGKDGELKEKKIIQEYVDEDDEEILAIVQMGSTIPNYWHNGNYRLQVSFMQVIVAESYFSAGFEEKPGNIQTETNLDRIFSGKKAAYKPGRDPINFNIVPEQFPNFLHDQVAVRIAYSDELNRIADYLKNGLSVLIICDKVIVEFLYKEICKIARKEPVVDELDFNLPDFNKKITEQQEGHIMILRCFEELMDTRWGSSVLFQTNVKGNHPQILAFCDSSVPVKQLFQRRFAVPERLQGIPRLININGQNCNPIPYLITKDEKSLFKDFNEIELYKHTAGLNILQFRNAFKYIQSIYKEPTKSENIYQTLRIFKQNTNSIEIDLPRTKFDEIGGYAQVKEQIETALALFQKEVSDIPAEHQKEVIPKGFIFHGPKGTGKTMFAKAIASRLNATLQVVSGPEVIEMWVGKSEENLRGIFATARRNAPYVIVFDEFDSIARQRSSVNTGYSSVANSLVAQLLTELDGFQSNEGVLVIGTTNKIHDIDPALTRPSRLKPILIDNPDPEARKEVARIHAKHYKIDTIIKTQLAICQKHLSKWEKSSKEIVDRKIPPTFLKDMAKAFPAFAKKIKEDATSQKLNEELNSFFKLIQGLKTTDSKNECNAPVINAVMDQVEILKKRLDIPEQIAEKKTIIQRELQDLHVMLQNERNGSIDFISESYFEFLLGLIADFTESWNNDQIANLFKGAFVAHSMEGRLLSPRYFGEQIGIYKSEKESSS